MTDQFSSQLSQWLSRHHAFVGSGKIVSDPLAGRALGPASGTLWDVFPFLVPCAFTGLFAGLSFSGIDPSTENVRLLEYRSRFGFHPVTDGPFAGNGWQTMTGEDWSKMVPTDYAPIDNLPAPVHHVDLRFALDGSERSTADPAWTYGQRDLSSRYTLHCWSHPDGLVVTAVCFASHAETNRPFLRPCHAIDPGAAVDPACLSPHRRMARLFGGLTVLTAGEEIVLDTGNGRDAVTDVPETDRSVTTTTVTVTKKPPSRSAFVRTISGVTPDSGGNMSLASTGSHKITRRYAELDTDTGHVTLIPHTLYLLSRDKPCCECDDYVADYERVRKMFAEREELIRRYNETYEKLKGIRDRLKMKFEDYAKPIRIRIEKTETRERDLRCEFILIYTNARREEYEHPPASIGLMSKNGTLSIRSAKILQHPRDTEMEIVDVFETTIKVSPLRSTPLTHRTVRLEAILAGPVPDDFAFEILPGDE